MEKFEVEFDRKSVALEFYDPREGERTDWLKYQAPLKKRQADLEVKEDPEEMRKFAAEIMDKKREIIFGLLKPGSELKTAEDMKKISCRDEGKIFDWFDGCIGVSTSKEKENFTKS